MWYTHDMKSLNYHLKQLMELSDHPIDTLTLSNIDEWLVQLCLCNREDIAKHVYDNESTIRRYAELLDRWILKNELEHPKLSPLLKVINNQIHENENLDDIDVTSIPLAFFRMCFKSEVQHHSKSLVYKIYRIMRCSNRDHVLERMEYLKQLSYEERMELVLYADLLGNNADFLLSSYATVGPLYLKDMVSLNGPTYDCAVTIRTEDIPYVSDKLYQKFYNLTFENEEDILKIPPSEEYILQQLSVGLKDIMVLARVIRQNAPYMSRSAMSVLETHFLRRMSGALWKRDDLWRTAFPWFDKINQRQPLSKEDKVHKKALCSYIRKTFKEDMEIAKKLGLMDDKGDREVLAYYDGIASPVCETSLMM